LLSVKSLGYKRRVQLARTLFLPVGKISRGKFLALAACLVGFKLALDWSITSEVFHQVWNPRVYVWSKSPVLRLSEARADELKLYCALLFVAAPFAWIGVCLCVQRLRAIGKPIWLVAFFFVPVAKWILFVLLVLTSSRSEEADKPVVRPERWWPFRTAAGSGAAAVIITTFITTLLSILSIQGLHLYGFTLFVGIPFFMGFIATSLHNLERARSFKSSLAATLISLALSAALFLALAYEGGDPQCPGLAAGQALPQTAA
jgi:uncharacterized membrane protein YhaH (DUF805 family)